MIFFQPMGTTSLSTLALVSFSMVQQPEVINNLVLQQYFLIICSFNF